jgi:hypothetical protein
MSEPTSSGGSDTGDHIAAPSGSEPDTQADAGPAPDAPALRGVPGYELLGELGRGGMGIVYKARHVSLNRLVALKLLRWGPDSSAVERARFRGEAEAVARLQHPNVVQIFEVGEQDGRPFLALELLEGGSLARRLGGTPRPAREAAGLVQTLARAVHAAHRLHIVHRDLKPDNVLLTADGTPKVADFGLAKLLDRDQGQTGSGDVVGTPSYMAPEQAQGQRRHIGPATDVYALGAVLYELLTGRPPFKAETPIDTILQVIADEPVPPSRLQPKVPRDLETICLKCLRKEPAQRYASAAALAEDLGRFLAGQPVAARPVSAVGRAWRWGRRNRGWVAALAITVGFAGVWLAPLVWRPHPDDAPDESPAARVVPFRPCHFAPQVSYTVGSGPYCVAVGDFNGDGKPDFAATHKDGVAVFLNNGDGTFRRGVSLAADSNPFGVAVGDFNGDGIPDLAVSREKAAAVSVYLGRGDGTFQEPRTSAAGSNPRGVAVGDFDGDGKLDLAVANGSDSHPGVSVLRGNGDGTFRPAVQYTSGKSAISVAVADLNGDGKLDLVTSNGGADTVRVLLGNGDGTFRPGVPYAVGSGPGVVVVADFNGDGHPDLAVENFSSNSVSVLLGNGDGTFRPAVSYPAGAGPGGLAVADFNGDGKPDLVVANHHSSNVSVLLGNGDGTFRPAVHYAAGWTPAGVAVGDFNGDGKPDLVVANYQGDDVSVLLNQPPAPHFRLSAPHARTADKEHSVFSVTALDGGHTLDTRYTGTVHITSSDRQAEFLQNDYTFKPEDNGIWSSGVKLKTAGAHTLTVRDREDGSRVGTVTILVEPGPARYLSVSTPPASQAGRVLRVTILARDAFANLADYRGTVRVTSSDPKAVLPRDYKFVESDNGGRWLPVTLRTPGEQTITVADTDTGTITGEAKVNVTP